MVVLIYENKSYSAVNFPTELALSDEISKSGKVILLYLLATPIAEPTYDDISLSTSLTRGTISNALKNLKNKGIIRVDKTSFHDCRNVYVLQDFLKWNI